MMRTQGQGVALKRQLLTNKAGLVELKNTSPLRVADSYPIETGLADYFRDVRQQAVTPVKVTVEATPSTDALLKEASKL